MHAVIDRIASCPGVELYVRWLEPEKSQGRGAILLNSRSLCVESSMGIGMGSQSYAEYLCGQGIDVFLVDLRGYGSSTPIEEQLCDSRAQLTHPLTVDDYYADLRAASLWARSRLGTDPELTLVGFSLLGPLVAIFANQCPELVDHVVCINPNWLADEADPPREAGKFVTDTAPDVPCAEVTMNSIRVRLESAQPPGRSYIEPLWFEQASEALARDHTTFDPVTETWKVSKWEAAAWGKHLRSQGRFTNMRADILIVHSQYDSENPYFIVKRFFETLATSRKYLKVLPQSTHLCIWEQARTTLYNWTAEFILL